MSKIRLKSTVGLSALTGIYVLLIVLYLTAFGGRYDTPDAEQAESYFKTTLYAMYSFPAFVLMLWLLNDFFVKPARYRFLITLVAIAFLSIYVASRSVIGL